LSDAPPVAVVVVSFNTRDDLLRCLASVTAGGAPEVVVVDNASADGSAEAVARDFPAVGLIRNAANQGFAKASNLGWRRAAAPLVLFLNSDTEVPAGAIDTLAALLGRRPDVAILGPRTVDADGVVQVSTGPDLVPRAEWRQGRLVRGVKRRNPAAVARAEAIHSVEHEPAWVSGACLMTRRSVLETLGGFDEGFFLYEEDVDLCVRARALGRVLFTPRATVRHRLGASMAKAPALARLEYHKSHLRYYRKHRGPVDVAVLRLLLLGRAGAAALRQGTGAPPLDDAKTLFRLALGRA
jgi:GT2 family glycosyltransferase